MDKAKSYPGFTRVRYTDRRHLDGCQHAAHGLQSAVDTQGSDGHGYGNFRGSSGPIHRKAWLPQRR